jgi:hypothetical protein
LLSKWVNLRRYTAVESIVDDDGEETDDDEDRDRVMDMLFDSCESNASETARASESLTQQLAGLRQPSDSRQPSLDSRHSSQQGVVLRQPSQGGGGGAGH